MTKSSTQYEKKRMTKFFLEILEYHHQLNKELIEQINKYGFGGEVIRLFSHMLSAHNIWNARINGLGVTITPWEVHSLEACEVINEMNYSMTKEILEKKNMDEEIKYETSTGEKYSNSVRDIVFHLLNHHTHHRAQIMAELSKLSYSPMITDYISKKR